jgi:hypothetical protein
MKIKGRWLAVLSQFAFVSGEGSVAVASPKASDRPL